MLNESREAVIKLYNDYFSIESEANYKAILGKGRPSKLACKANISNRLRLSNLFSYLKILTSRQMLQR